MTELRNDTNIKFTDISSEQWREYQTTLGVKRIEQPLYLAVSENGHRILDANGASHYVDTRHGFFLSWQAKEGKPHFVK